MKKIKVKIKVIVVVLAMLLIAAGSAYLDYHVWSLKHPNAPLWTYFF